MVLELQSTGKFSDVTITNSITILNDKIQTNEGGTGFNSYTRGDLLAAEATTQLVKVPIGKNGQYLTVDNGVPGSIRWTTPQSVVNATTSTSGIVVLAKVILKYYLAYRIQRLLLLLDLLVYLKVHQ